MKASSRLHHLLFSTVMRAPVSFFDLTPRGHIVNRFSRDMDESKNNVDFPKQRSLLLIFSIKSITVRNRDNTNPVTGIHLSSHKQLQYIKGNYIFVQYAVHM